MANSMVGIPTEGFYIVKGYNLSWLKGAIFATYLSSDKSNRIIEIFLFLSNDKNEKNSKVEIRTEVSLLPRIKDMRALFADIVNSSLQYSQYQFGAKDSHFKEPLEKYDSKDVGKDLKRRAQCRFDIIGFSRLFRESVKQIMIKTKCQKLKDDILRYGGIGQNA